MRRLAALAALALCASPALGAPEQPLADPALEARAQDLAREIRCVVCENEPVALSSAEIAVDMRRAIRERVAAGDSDAQVRQYFASRYGQFVLLRPPVDGATLALWGAPLALLLMGAGGLWLATRRRGEPVAADHRADDEAARDALRRAEGQG